MSNIITLNYGISDARSIVMSNQGTDSFLDLLIASADSFGQSTSQKKLVAFLRERRVLNDIAPGTAGFEIEEMPWDYSFILVDRLFLMDAANNAMTETTLNKLPYEVNKDIVFPWLKQFAEMMDSATFSFPIREITGFRKNKDGKFVPAYKKGKYTHERIQFTSYINNLVVYDGYHLLLTTETKPFTELQTFASGMGFAYIDDNGKFVTPFGFKRLHDKTFVGICMESWDEFKENINSHSSRYYKFLDL
ncbi:MAG: hypothetical protein IJG59_05285 [Erysipelotrichaceae bacterium]|nr:hypothetical protein [Erysipelotrichaceae bacterium]